MSTRLKERQGEGSEEARQVERPTHTRIKRAVTLPIVWVKPNCCARGFTGHSVVVCSSPIPCTTEIQTWLVVQKERCLLDRVYLETYLICSTSLRTTRYRAFWQGVSPCLPLISTFPTPPSRPTLFVVSYLLVTITNVPVTMSANCRINDL
jgi:hypothetical protein